MLRRSVIALHGFGSWVPSGVPNAQVGTFRDGTRYDYKQHGGEEKEERGNYFHQLAEKGELFADAPIRYQTRDRLCRATLAAERDRLAGDVISAEFIEVSTPAAYPATRKATAVELADH